MIDLRSDTLTRPSEAMRDVMRNAACGDDGYGDDPSINQLQELAAETLGKEEALFLPSGTMANLVAIMTHTRPSDSVVVGYKAHSFLYESGGPAALAGVLPIVVGHDGTFTWEDVEKNALGGDVHLAPTTLVMMENTHNGGGGIVFPQEHIGEICEKARFWNIAAHIDGARIMNAAAALGKSASELCAPADTVSLCLSKGLGCPVGSVLAGPAEFIARARRFRELLGGGMRQAGIVASAGVYALRNNVGRLAEDHANARLLAENLASLGGLHVDLDKVQTNMVFIETRREDMAAFNVVLALREKGVLANPMGKDRIRCVTHLDVGRDGVLKAADAFKEVMAR